MSIPKTRKCFTFTWTLENASYCWQKSIWSPSFVISALQESKFQLELYPRGSMNDDFIGFYLHKQAGPSVEIECEFALLSKHGSVLASRKTKMSENIAGCYNLKERKEVFIVNRSVYLPEDKLTARCTIWNVETEMTEDVQCFSRSQICIEKEVFLWKIRNFSSLRTEEKRTYQIKSVQDNELLMTFDLHFTNPYTDEDSITIQIVSEISKVKYFMLHVMPVNAYGNAKEGIKKEFCCENKKPKLFNLPFSRKDLIANKIACLPNNVLSFRCECIFSTGEIISKIESVVYDCESLSDSEPDSHCSNENKLSKSRHILNDDLKSLLHDCIYSDIKLKTNTGTFLAHKSILSARSPVFKAMFENNMREKLRECIDIQDLDGDTVYRMLQYVYTAEIPDLQWESACNLYRAADKYEILALRDECSVHLKSNLCLKNACELLILADVHQDEDLKVFTQDFLFSYDVVNSANWEQLMKTHLKLAADTMRLQIQRKTLTFPNNKLSTMASGHGNSSVRRFFALPELNSCAAKKLILSSFTSGRSSEKTPFQPSNSNVEETPYKLSFLFTKMSEKAPDDKPSFLFGGRRESMPVKPSTSDNYKVPAKPPFSFDPYTTTSNLSSGCNSSVAETPSKRRDGCSVAATYPSTGFTLSEMHSTSNVLNNSNAKTPFGFGTPYVHELVTNPRSSVDTSFTSSRISRTRSVKSSAPSFAFGNNSATTSAFQSRDEDKHLSSGESSTEKHDYLLLTRANSKISSASHISHTKTRSALAESYKSIAITPSVEKTVYFGRANIKEQFSSENPNLWYTYPRGYAIDQLGFRKGDSDNGSKHKT